MAAQPPRPPLLVYLGGEIRIEREAAGLTQQELGRRVFVSGSFISMVETGRRTVRRETITVIDGTLDCQGRLIRAWELATDDDVTVLAGELVDVEAEATRIRAYHPVFVPGLLQTEGYARVLLDTGRYSGAADGQIEQRLATRLARQRVLTAGRLRSYWVILDESILHRDIGGPEVMQEQLAHLLVCARSERINIQVMSYSDGSYPAPGPMTILDVNGMTMVHVEDPVEGRMVHDPSRVVRYEDQFEVLRSQAASMPESERMIAARMENL